MSDFGNKDGIGPRLAYWANQLSRDKNYPWVGTGLIADLKCAAKQHGADYDKLYPLLVAAPPEPEEDEFANWQAPVEEYDL